MSKTVLFRRFNQTFRLILILNLVLGFVPTTFMHSVSPNSGVGVAHAQVPVITATKQDALVVDIDGQDLYVHWINVRDGDVAKRSAAICGLFEPLLRRIFE